jgi:glucoside 3-dehydrogenase (cytochrome c) hitch-hiker subunit
MPSRREALRQIALSGAAVVSAPAWVENLLAIADQHAAHRRTTKSAAPTAWSPKVLNAHQNELVTTVSELIIPATDTPGATAAQVNRYIDGVLADAKPADRDAFLQGLAWLDARSEQRSGKGFVNIPPEQQIELLKTLDAAASLEPSSDALFRPAGTGPELVGAAPGTGTANTPRPAITPEDRPGVDVYRALKAMTCAGYYSSEIGVLQEIGDDGQLFLAEFKGCTHKEHGAP